MVKLLSANFLRLIQDKIFRGGLILTAAWGVIVPVKRHMDALQYDYTDEIENGFLSYALFAGIVMAVFCSLFLGTEYNDGTIRNKIVVGGKRREIYLADTIVSSAAGLAMWAAYLLSYLCVGIPLTGAFTADRKMLLLMGLTALLLTAAFTSIFTLIAMVCQNKAATAVICILLAFGSLMAGIVLNEMLDAPPTHPVYSLDDKGNMTSSEVPNPKYLEGVKKEIVQTIYDINPGGQAIQCAALTAANPLRLPLYSLAVMTLSTGAGCVLFEKKDLK